MDTIKIETLMKRCLLFSAPKGQICTNEGHEKPEPAEWVFRLKWGSDPFEGYATCKQCLQFASSKIEAVEEPEFEARGCLLEQTCWKCTKDGVIFAVGFIKPSLDADFCGYAMNVMREPFISLLREYFSEHPDKKARFGRVKQRKAYAKWEKEFGEKVLSQGCPHCDTSWGWPKLKSGHGRAYEDIVEGRANRLGEGLFPCDAKHVIPPAFPWYTRGRLGVFDAR